ncbi:MAG: right-handed parallel beta-helix repeat-containing protein [Gemmatimonadales bacterium]
MQRHTYLELDLRRSEEYLRGSAAVLNVRDWGARGDGTSDDTAAFQHALDAAGPAGGTVLVPRGRYRFSVPLGIRGDRTELVGLGGSRLVAATLLDRLIDSNNFSGLRLHGLTLEGAGVQAVGGRGAIHLDEGSTGCVVSRCRILNAPGTAITDDGRHNLVVHNVIEGTGEHGIYSSGGLDSEYHDNHLRNVGRVAGTTLGCHGISLAGSTSCTVAGNTIVDTDGVGIALRDGAHHCTVRSNAISAGTDRHIALGTASDCTIIRNTLRDVAAGFDAIRIDGGGRLVIADNLIRRATAGGAGIRWTTAGVTGGDDVYGNTIVLEGAAISQPGIDADSGTLVDVRIHGNTIRAVHGAAPPGAIQVRSGARVRVYGNRTRA